MQSTELGTNSRISTAEHGRQMLMVFVDNQGDVPKRNQRPLMTVQSNQCTWTSRLDADQILAHAAMIFDESIRTTSLTGEVIVASFTNSKGSLTLEKTEPGKRSPWSSLVVFTVPTVLSVSFPSEALSRLIRDTSEYPRLSPSQLQRYIDDFITPEAAPQFPTREVV